MIKKISRRDFIKDSVIIGAGATTVPSLITSKNAAAQNSDHQRSLLLCPPFLGCPTQKSMTINLVGGEDPITCYIRYANNTLEKPGWQQTESIFIAALTPKEIVLKNLIPETEYRYQVYARKEKESDFEVVVENSFRTQKISRSSFSFAMFSDSHINPFKKARYSVLNRITSSILARKPDIALMLGDNIQTFASHGGPMTEKRFGPVLYAHLRHAIGDVPSIIPIFNVMGNWEGENGWHSKEKRQWAREARLSFIPTPGVKTYPEGGSSNGDYYGFNWGAALFLVLNVTGYTIPDHAMHSPIGKPDDWSLGEKQKQWLYGRLSHSEAKWKFLFIHHTVAGNAGDDVNSRYGRGGGRAANVGEQATIHKWMKEFNVQALFYGHDHVFTDIPVDGIHYVCVGSAGAPWKFTEAVTGYDKYWKPSGYTWVDVYGNKVKIAFIEANTSSTEYKVLHSFEITI